MQKGDNLMLTGTKPIVIAVAAALMSACASNVAVKSSDDKKEPVVQEKLDCKKMVRNLTLPWNSDPDVCNENRSVGSRSVVSELVTEKQKIEDRLKRNAYLSQKRKEREKTAVLIKAEAIVSEPVVSTPVNIAPVKAHIQPVAVQKLNDEELIWFAKHVRILGPQGTERTLSLLPRISASEKILLRGFFMKDEIGDYDPEVFSVARALAVKKKLVEEGNVDPERITILHHLPDASGRYVRVSVNG